MPLQPESLDGFADELGIMDEINQPGNNVANGANKNKNKNKMDNVNSLQPSTSTPIGNVPPPNITRGAPPPGVVTRSAARYLSTCLSFLLLLV